MKNLVNVTLSATQPLLPVGALICWTDEAEDKGKPVLGYRITHGEAGISTEYVTDGRFIDVANVRLVRMPAPEAPPADCPCIACALKREFERAAAEVKAAASGKPFPGMSAAPIELDASFHNSDAAPVG